MSGEQPSDVAAPVPTIDTRTFRNAMGLFATGVTVITTRLGDIVHGMTANAFSSVSLDPMLVLVCVDRKTRMHDLILEARAFAVNVLAEDQEVLSGHFAGRGKDGPPPPSLRFVDGPDGEDDGGVPTVAGCVTAIRCALEQAYPGGDHTILLGRVTELRPGRAGMPPLLWFGGRYHRLAEPHVAAPPAPDLWTNAEVAVYHHEWEQPPDPDESPMT